MYKDSRNIRSRFVQLGMDGTSTNKVKDVPTVHTVPLPISTSHSLPLPPHYLQAKHRNHTLSPHSCPKSLLHIDCIRNSLVPAWAAQNAPKIILPQRPGSAPPALPSFHSPPHLILTTASFLLDDLHGCQMGVGFTCCLGF